MHAHMTTTAQGELGIEERHGAEVVKKADLLRDQLLANERYTSEEKEKPHRSNASTRHSCTPRPSMPTNKS
jgi:hypothetical protein